MASILGYDATYTSANMLPGIELIGGREIARVAVFIDPANPASFNARVELKGNIGIFTNDAEGNPTFNVIIFRNGVEIYRATSEIDLALNTITNQIVSVMAIDGAIPGLQTYQLAVEPEPGDANQIFVRGPIAFSATVIGL
ncbi:hypothetical protein V3851_05480 [Paenibacillus sp. M1]|uniref:DUF4183 domain-containing protein n=2 Tax=Paenibacillus haidiansis TaxID=1574488 RepID=A0ABU7VPF1_9BACL